MEEKDHNMDINIGSSGWSFGCCLAIVISYAKWHSIIWAIIHGILGWFYVIYYIIKYTGGV